MKLAIATDANMVSRHFGHCEGFTMFEIEGKEIKNKEFIVSPGHKKGFLPVFLNDHGANVVVSGGMGGGAINIFNEKGIDVITGASGNVDDIAKSYIEGTLVSTGSVCHEHQHAGECGEH